MPTVAAGLAIRAGVTRGPVKVLTGPEQSCSSPSCWEAVGQACAPGRLQAPSPQPSSPRGLRRSAAIRMKGNSKSLAFSLPLEEVLVEDELPGMLCQGNAA